MNYEPLRLRKNETVLLDTDLGYFHMPATPPYNTAEINLTGADARFFKIRVDNLTDEAR